MSRSEITGALLARLKKGLQKSPDYNHAHPLLSQDYHSLYQESLNQLLLGEFLDNLQTGEYREWDLWKQASGDVKARTFKGRTTPAPVKHGPGDRSESYHLGNVYLKNKNQVYVPTIPLWKCKNDRERYRMIMKADVSIQIKADLLEALA